MTTSKSRLFFGALSLLFLLLGLKFSVAQNNNSDAIGVRVVPNPNHYSAARWYESQGFKGSPQALTVDGYDAIRDGRTVYVSASNINTDTRVIYTNIYLISYNQSPATPTVDILGKIIKNWKFNSNLGPSGNPTADVVNPSPTCSITSKRCETDKDCGAKQKCVYPSGLSSSDAPSGLCSLSPVKNCSVDTDCPANFFCNNLKSKVIRDIKRIGKLEEIKEVLYRFKKANSRFPTLAAGSYLPNNTISTWPSWNDNLLSDLAAPQTLKDPINRLGDCLGYDQNTCWNANSRTYVNSVSPGSLPTLPAGSYAMAYQSNASGSEYLLCATLETRNNSLPINNYTFYFNDPSGDSCPMGVAITPPANQAPILVSQSLTGEYNQEFNGYLEVFDYDNDPLAWTLNTSGVNWTAWSAAPTLVDTTNPNIKNVYAVRAGYNGTYSPTLNVSDGRGGLLSVVVPINISIVPPSLEADDYTFTLDPTMSFDYSFYFTTKNPKSPLSNSYSVTLLEGAPDLLNAGGLAETVAASGVNRYKVNFSGIVPTSTNQFSENVDLKYQITAIDNLNNTFTKIVHINLISPKPNFYPNCPTTGRSGQYYSCVLGGATQGNYSITYTKVANTVPQELIISNCQNNSAQKCLAGTLVVGGSGNVTYSPTLKAASDYGAYRTSNYNLVVSKSYCGDGIKQSPNSENRGGPQNNGNEECDGLDSTTLNPLVSSPTLQYGCTTGVGVVTPNPITTYEYCRFKAIDNGGGYCGDGLCQDYINIGTSTVNLVAVENSNNCPQDCSDLTACNVTNTNAIETIVDNYKIYTFNSSGNFTLGAAARAEILVVAGGGGSHRNGGGGGGGGGVVSGVYDLPATQHAVTVGAGGWKGYEARASENGGNSSFGSIVTAIGGGGGASRDFPPAGKDGGSGGGGSGAYNTFPYYLGGNGIAGQGYKGGNGTQPDRNIYSAGGGGGGAGGQGGNSSYANQVGIGGAGGPGIANSITGSLVMYAGGGGGGITGNHPGATPGLGGIGGGGNGGIDEYQSGVSGTPNTGGGAGADGGEYGGSGVVIVKCLNSSCSCNNKECGDDGCGNSCGTCSGQTQCINNQCIPSCPNGICNSGNGENCNNCPDCACTGNTTCYNNSCCTPNCSGNTCGSDGCGGTCFCDTGYKCNNNNCELLTGCGFNGCEAGENCSNCAQDCPCPGGTICTQNGTCVASSCGINGCEPSLGENCLNCEQDCGCVAPQVCKANGICCEADCHGCIGGLSTILWSYCGGSCCNPLTEKCCNTGYVSYCIGISEICGAH